MFKSRHTVNGSINTLCNQSAIGDSPHSAPNTIETKRITKQSRLNAAFTFQTFIFMALIIACTDKEHQEYIETNVMPHFIDALDLDDFIFSKLNRRLKDITSSPTRGLSLTGEVSGAIFESMFERAITIEKVKEILYGLGLDFEEFKTFLKNRIENL